jgi:L-lysine exporter family protein LysE/ArgO
MVPRVIGSFLAGLGLQASLIVAVGPQNAFVLRQGLCREHVWPVVALCTLADVALLAAGAGGVSAAVCALPWLQSLLRWSGAAAVGAFGVRALARAIRPGALSPAEGAFPGSRGAAVRQAAAFTFLNPHVYLDALLFAGTVAASQPAGGAPWFVAGASAASAAWFCGIGLAAQALAPRLARPSAFRLLDAATGVVMCLLALRLVVSTRL